MVGDKLKNAALVATLTAATTVAGFAGMKSEDKPVQPQKDKTTHTIVAKEPVFDQALPPILEEMFQREVDELDRKELAGLKCLSFEQAKKMREDVCRSYRKSALDFENNVDYLYLCSSGKLTVGFGCNVNDWKRFSLLMFKKEDGTYMSLEEKKDLYKRLCKERDGIKDYNVKHTWYKENWCDNNKFPQPTPKSIERLNRFCVRDAFNKLCDNFSKAGMDLGYFASEDMLKTGNYENSFIMGAMDLQYNTGKFTQDIWKRNYGALKKAVKAFKKDDMKTFASYMALATEETHRKETAKGVKKRNEFTRQCFANCTSLYHTQDYTQAHALKTFNATQGTTR